MTDSLLQIAPHLAGALLVGVLIGWLIRAAAGNRRLSQLCDEWQIKFDEAARQRDRFNSENIKIRANIETLQALVAKHEHAAARSRTDMQSAAEKIKALTKDHFTLRTERDGLESKLSSSQGALGMANGQLKDLQEEFVKSGNFYKGELEKALEKRTALKDKLDDARAEHDSLSNLLESSRSEHESANKMLAAAQTRLDNLDAMEQKVIELEAETAELRHQAASKQQKVDALLRDVAELDELKIQNKELAHCLKSMESSRKQYEIDAQRYRAKAHQSVQQSETLRMKLDDVESSFAEIAKQHDNALKVAKTKIQTKTNGQKEDKEVDDLTQIVGIGKVFQQTLHDLGIYSYRQIASFGPADIARVNMELKEFRGRMEQDDWVGQAKELLFRKYGETH